MKKIYNTLLLLLAPLMMMGQGINFEHISLDKAIAKAKAENKLVFIDGYAVWCGPCKKMANTVFKEEAVGKFFAENFVALKVDVERGEGPFIKRKYGITSLPGYVFIDGDGLVVYREGAAMPTQRFLDVSAKALEYAKDVNSVGRLNERYEQEKNSEAFLKLYLDKMKESNSTGYTDLVEQYLTVQTSMEESSKEMVSFLNNHAEQLIYGGKADSIIQRNLRSDAWKLWVRKEIRQTFKDLPKKMLETTTSYAVSHRDTVKLEYLLNLAGDVGAVTGEAGRKRLYTYYYAQTGQGDKYKPLVRDDNEVFIQSLDVAQLRAVYLKNLKQREDGDVDAQSIRPYALKISEQISAMVSMYANYATSQQDNEDVVRWMKAAYDMVPGLAKTMSQYADILYMFGNDSATAIEIKEKAYELSKAENAKDAQGLKIDLETMKAGNQLSLKNR